MATSFGYKWKNSCLNLNLEKISIKNEIEDKIDIWHNGIGILCGAEMKNWLT